MAKDEPRWLRLDQTRLDDLFRSHSTDPIAVACANAVKSRLLGGGIVYAADKGKAQPSEVFVEHVDRHFGSFARDAVDAILVQGFAAYVVTDEDVPVVIPNGAADVWYRYNKYFQLELAVFGEDAKPRKDVYVMTKDKVMPDGGLTSAAAVNFGNARFKVNFLCPRHVPPLMKSPGHVRAQPHGGRLPRRAAATVRVHAIHRVHKPRHCRRR